LGAADSSTGEYPVAKDTSSYLNPELVLDPLQQLVPLLEVEPQHPPSLLEVELQHPPSFSEAGELQPHEAPDRATAA
jgi:hypothetical protein